MLFAFLLFFQASLIVIVLQAGFMTISDTESEQVVVSIEGVTAVELGLFLAITQSKSSSQPLPSAQ